MLHACVVCCVVCPPQGAALTELQLFFPALASSGAAAAAPESLIKMLLDAGRGRYDQFSYVFGLGEGRGWESWTTRLVVMQGSEGGGWRADGGVKAGQFPWW
jgi:hypothetical protein